MPDDDMESLLRDTLSERAANAPQSGLVEQRTLAAVRRGPVRRPRPGWLRPIVVACLVLVVVGAAAGGTALVRNLTTGTHQVAATRTSTATPSGGASTATASTPLQPSCCAATPTETTASQPTSTPVTPVGPVGGPVPKGFRVADLTFVSTLEGWALGTTPTCTQRPCTSLVRTTDGGHTWRGISPPVVGLSTIDACTSACVSGVRFANPLDGYLFGPKVLYLTTDGGAHWSKQVGGATALEISRGNVLRVSTTCSPGCSYVVQMSAIGATSWHQIFKTTGLSGPDSAGLVREGATAFVQIYGNAAGGADSAHSDLYRSTDNGTTWTDLGEPCPQNAGSPEIDSTAMATGQKGTLAVLCQPRQGKSGSFVATFARGATKAVAGTPLSGLEQPIGALSTSIVFAQRPRASGQGVLIRSTNGGRTWAVAQTTKIPPPLDFPGFLGFLGFETATTGRWVSPADPSTVWTTTNGGANWTPYTFAS